MKPYRSLKHLAGGLIFLAILNLAWTSTAQDDSLVAMGIVNSSGTLLNSTNTVGGVVSIDDNGTGNHDVVIDAAGAFAGAGINDFIVEVTRRGSDTDDYHIGEVTARTDDKLTVTIRSADLEQDDGSPSATEAVDSAFNFLIRRLNSADSTIPSGTAHLLALGRISSGGAPTFVFGVGDIAVTSTGAGAGDYEITLTETGAFTGDNSNDYVVLAQPRNSGLADEIATLSSITTASDDNIIVNIRTFDVQTAVASGLGTAFSDDFFFTVYRIPDAPEETAPASRLLVAAANVTSTGSLLEGATSIPGGVVTATDTATGRYEVNINAAGAFFGKDPEQYIAIATIRESILIDRIVQATVLIVNENTLRVELSTQDVEEDTEAVGLLEDEDFAVAIYDAGATFQPDMHIGEKRKLSKMKGDDRYNKRGGGQGIKLKLADTMRKRFHFATENDGTSIDSFSAKQKGAGRIVILKFFRLTGGKKNVTAAVRTGKAIAQDVRPGENVIFQGFANYRSSSKTPTKKIRLTGNSEYATDSDTVRIKTSAAN